MKSTSWRLLFWPWIRLGDPEAARAAREQVAHLKPAVVITGGSRGIGFALALQFMKAGRDTAIIARNALRLEEAAAELKRRTAAEATTILCDVSEPSAMDVITSALDRKGLYLDVLVNNAGIGLAGPFATHGDTDLHRLITLNIDALTRLTRAALPAMLARQRGGILNIGSIGGCAPGPNQAVYYASKAYVASFTEAIASEVSGRGVRISVVLPGPVNTDFQAAMGAEESPYRLLLPSSSADQIARSAYRGFVFGLRVIVPGIFNKAMFLALRVLPHTVTVPIIYWLLKRPGRS